MLQELTQLQGICVSLLENAKDFIEQKSLKLIWQPNSYPMRDYYLIAHKKRKDLFEMLKKLLLE